MQEFHELKVSKIERLTDKAVSVHFKIPADKKDLYSYTPGQYLSIETSLDGKNVRRSYSLSSCPHDDTLRVGIKQIPDGVFSTYVNQKLQEGDVLKVSNPDGEFVLVPQEGKHYAAIAAGSGITPIMSMIKHTLRSTDTAQFYLLFGNQTLASTMYSDQLKELQASYPDRLHVLAAYSQERVDGERYGRIDRGMINFAFKNPFGNQKMDSIYLCGPAALVTESQRVLKDLGYDDSQVHDELFFNDSIVEAPTPDDGTSEVTLILEDEEHIFNMKRDQTILDAALAAGIDPPYSCRGGVCSTCLALCQEGSTAMEKNAILVDSEIEEGFTLACQAHPTAAKVTINFDEV